MQGVSRFALLRQRDLRYVVGASTVSLVGDGVVTVALAFAVLDLTDSATDLGIVFALRTLAQVAALLIGGVVADRVSRRALMMGADIVRMCCQAGIGVLLLSGHATIAEVIVSQVFVGAAAGFFDPASGGLIPAVAGESLQEANALQGLLGSAVGVIGPIVGGAVVVGVGSSWAMLIDAGSYLGSALLLARVSRQAAAAVNRDGKKSTFFADLHDGFREVTSRTWVWTVILTFSVTNALAGTWSIFGPLVCRRDYGGAAAYALLSALWGLGAMLGGFVLMRVKPRRPLRAGTLACLPWAIPMILLACGVPLAIVVPFQLVSGAGPIIFNTLWWTTLQQQVPPESISRVISYDFAGSFALSPIGQALAGPLAVAAGLSPAMILCGGLALFVMVPNLLITDVRTLEAAAPDPMTA